MALAHAALFLWSFPALAFGNFHPIPLEKFAENQEKRGVRRFSHSEHHLLEGGTALSLSWKATLDPDTILALDSEREAGVHLVSCSPSSLVLHLPSSHVDKANTWRHVTASETLHGCAHLEDHPLYHRVVGMEFTKHPETPRGGKTVVFTTEELYSASQVLPNLEFNYHTTPIDALHPDQQAEAMAHYEHQKLTTAGDGKEQTSESSARRLQLNLQGQNFLPGQNGYLKGFHKSVGQVDVTNSFKPAEQGNSQSQVWKPMTHANFGWNWNYHTDAIRNPQFKYRLPGMRGYILLKDPYLKFHGLFHINFTSHWNGTNPFASAPHVRMNTKFEGNAYVNADLGLMTDIYKDISRDFKDSKFSIPMLDNFTKETHYFKKVRFYIGSIPIMLEPGVSVDLNACHLGLFKGGVRLGVNCHLRVSASAFFDSNTGIDGQVSAEALNVKLLPPTWMIYTKHVEFGALLTPTFWLKGAIGPVRDVTVELQLRPFVNASITQEGAQSYGVQQQVMEKELIIFPFRAINLPIGSEWSVGIEANSRRKMTDVQMSLGVAEFANYHHIEHFTFGLVNQRRLLHDPMHVTLWRNGVKQMGTPVKIYCEQTVNGECQPAPANAYFQIDMKPVIVQLTLAWHDSPVSFLMNKVRAISLVFPQLALTGKASQEFRKDPPQKVFMKITRNGRTYKAAAKPEIVHDHLVLVHTKQTQDLGIAWLDAWRVKYGSISGQQQVTNLIDPQIELWYQRQGRDERVSYTSMPPISWDNVLVGNRNPNAVYHTGAFVGNVPVQISMPHANSQNTYATGTMGVDVHSPESCNRWLVPASSMRLAQGQTYTLYWTARHAKLNKPQDFKFSAWRLDKRTGNFLDTTMKTTIKGAKCHMKSPSALQSPASRPSFNQQEKECVFSQQLKVEDGLVGVTVVLELGFLDASDGTTHKLLSAPVSFVAYKEDVHPWEETRNGWGKGRWHDADFDNTRRLQEEGGNMVSAPPGSNTGVDVPMASLPLVNAPDDNAEDQSPRRLGSRRLQYAQPKYGASPSNISFNDQMAALHPICNRKPLHYQIGAGIYFRARVANLNMDGTSPIAALASFANNFDTNDIPLISTGLGKKLASLLPDKMCNLGVCDGILPGCPGQQVDPMVVPKVEFQWNRSFNWNNATQQKLKTAVAFGMALTPEIVRVTSIVASSILHESKLLSTTKGPYGVYGSDTYYNNGNVVYVNNKPCRWSAPPDCAKTFQYSGNTYDGCSVTDHQGKGWCSVDKVFEGNWRNCRLLCHKGSRRLHSEAPGSAASEPAETKHTVVDFEPGSVQYKIDEELIHTLIRRQAFRGVEDGREATHGEAKIVGFRLLREQDHQAEFIPVGPEEKFEMAPQDRPQEKFNMHFHSGPLPRSAIQSSTAALVVESLPLPAIGAAVVAFAITTLAGGYYCVSRRKEAQLYSQVESAPETPAEE